MSIDKILWIECAFLALLVIAGYCFISIYESTSKDDLTEPFKPKNEMIDREPIYDKRK